MDTVQQKKSKHPTNYGHLVWVALGLIAIGAVLSYAYVSSNFEVSKQNLVLGAVVLAVGVCGVWWLQQRYLIFLRSRNIAFERVAVFGASDAGVNLARQIQQNGNVDGMMLVVVGHTTFSVAEFFD